MSHNDCMDEGRRVINRLIKEMYTRLVLIVAPLRACSFHFSMDYVLYSDIVTVWKHSFLYSLALTGVMSDWCESFVTWPHLYEEMYLVGKCVLTLCVHVHSILKWLGSLQETLRYSGASARHKQATRQSNTCETRRPQWHHRGRFLGKFLGTGHRLKPSTWSRPS